MKRGLALEIKSDYDGGTTPNKSVRSDRLSQYYSDLKSPKYLEVPSRKNKV